MSKTECRKGDNDEGDELEAVLPRTIKRSKPFKYAYEKEIVMYAYFKVSRFDLFMISSSHLRADLGNVFATRNWIITRPNAFTRRLHIVGTRELWSKISKPFDPAQSWIL